MLDFQNLNGKELSKANIAFRTVQEAKTFCTIIRETLEVRIGEAITQQTGEARAAEFVDCAPGEEEAWLRENCPDYARIVQEQSEKLERELIKYADRVPGRIPAAP